VTERFSYLDLLECTGCGAVLDAHERHQVCPACGKVLFARYDLAALREAMPQAALEGRRHGLWRYHELLPVTDPARAIGLGEGASPLLPLPADASEHVGMQRGELLIKDEAHNPTGSFKARGMAVAVARAAELGATDVAVPSAGNAGAAAAAYAAAHRLAAHVAMPRDAPASNRAEVANLWGRADAGRRAHRRRGSPHPRASRGPRVA
jgi:threonine synthase